MRFETVAIASQFWLVVCRMGLWRDKRRADEYSPSYPWALAGKRVVWSPVVTRSITDRPITCSFSISDRAGATPQFGDFSTDIPLNTNFLAKTPRPDPIEEAIRRWSAEEEGSVRHSLETVPCQASMNWPTGQLCAQYAVMDRQPRMPRTQLQIQPVCAAVPPIHSNLNSFILQLQAYPFDASLMITSPVPRYSYSILQLLAE